MKDLLTKFIAAFKKFDENEIAAIVENTQVESFKKGTIILKEGKICHKCFFVLQGCLRQYQLVNGEEKTTGFFVEGQAAVLYSSYLERKPSEYYLSCVEDCVLITGSREQEQKLHAKYPKLEYLTHTLMPQDHARAEERIAMLSHCNPEERYLRLSETQPGLLNRVPLYYIASYLGVTPESFSRIRKRIAIKDRSK